MGVPRWVIAAEQGWDAVRLRRAAARQPARFRIESYGGHGSSRGIVVRGRVLDDPPLSQAVEGEGVRRAVGRTLRGFLTDELPGVPLRVTAAGASAEVVSDSEGYFLARLEPGSVDAPWTTGTAALAGEYRGLTGRHVPELMLRVPGRDAALGLISDIDDTILETGVQRVGRMIFATITGSAVTRLAVAGAPQLYRAMADGARNPFFYISSSPWNLHAFLEGFLRHRGFPRGPVLLRDLLGGAGGREQKHGRIREVLDMHSPLKFVLIGDSAEKDPEIYADIVREYPGRILAVYIREARLDPGDGRVERVSGTWAHETPFVLAADAEAVRRHATGLGLVASDDPGQD